MIKVRVFIFISFLVFGSLMGSSGAVSVQNNEIRTLCREAQDLEEKIGNDENSIDTLLLQEKNSAPILKNIYVMLTRCFTLLFDLQRFSPFLVVSAESNQNDFVRCSIIIKNFSSYFDMVSERLAKNTKEIVNIKQIQIEKKKELAEYTQKYEKLLEKIKNELAKIPREKEEGIIKNVVYHIATKSNSIEELDAELESENAVGVLRNTKINTALSLMYPVKGKIVGEFGDSGKNNEMTYCLSFETRKGAIVTSPAKGLVVFAGKFLNYGNMVIISNGEYRVFIYGMGDEVYTNTGDVVEIGDYVGKMRSDGRGNPVINMELRKFGETLDPRHFLFETIERGGPTA